MCTWMGRELKTGPNSVFRCSFRCFSNDFPPITTLTFPSLPPELEVAATDADDDADDADGGGFGFDSKLAIKSAALM